MYSINSVNEELINLIENSGFIYRNQKTICCIYDVSNFYTKEYELQLLRDFINYHDMVIVDEPLVMYQKFDIKNDIVK